uniref:Uncharacterized protein n=1 Tax=Brassica oleracea TaxID=3712 RepID=A0A3P6D397_BRAOL|nr:unnamed protein product [Brassica oleracea]
MTSKITFFLFLALVISCATMVSVSTAKAQHCIDSKDCPNTSCKTGQIERCVHNQCTCVPLMVNRAGKYLFLILFFVSMCLIRCNDGECFDSESSTLHRF